MQYYDDNDDEFREEHSAREDGHESREDGHESRQDSPQNDEDGDGHRQAGEYRPGQYSEMRQGMRQNPDPNRQEPAKPGNGMALASLLCGIFGSLSLCLCVAFPLSILLGVAAVTLSFLSRRDGRFSGPAIAGLVLGFLAVLLGIAECVYLIFLNYMLQDPQMADIFEQMIEQYGTQPAK